MAIEQRWSMENADINRVGEKLGYDWNAVCDEVRRADLYGQDGDGSIDVSRDEIDDFDSPVLKAIFAHIFASHPEMTEITIIN